MAFREPEKYIFLVTVHMRPPTLDGHNFLVQTSIRVFLDSIEIPLSIESIHI